MYRAILVAIILLAFLQQLNAYDVVLKSGKTIHGTLIREDAQLIMLKDESGMYHNFKKMDVDLGKTAAINKNAAKPAPKTAKRVYTNEDVQRVREKFDLGQGSYGESTRVDLPGSEEFSAAENKQLTSFEESVLHSELPVLVEFWAEWCGPCRKFAPVIDRVATQFEGEATVVKVNIDKEKPIASAYQIHAIPTILFFRNGEVVDRIVGAVSETILSGRLQSLVKKKRTDI